MEKGTIIYAPIVPPTDLDQFPTHLANLGKGGLHFKNNLGAIQSIAAALREQGMLAYDKSTDKYYKLNQAGAWVEFTVSGQGNGMINVSTTSNLPTENIEDGTLAFVKSEISYYSWSAMNDEWGKVSIIVINNDTSLFLRGDGQWAAPPSGSNLNYPNNPSQYLRGDGQWGIPFNPPGAEEYFLNGEGVWALPPTGTFLNFPNDITKFLRSDGSWQVPVTTAVSALIALANNVLDIAWSNMGVYTAYISSTVTLAFTSRGYGFISIRINMESTGVINLPAWVALISGEFIPGSYNLLQIVSFTNSGTDSGSAWAIITQQQ